jgi:hypothetical protein
MSDTNRPQVADRAEEEASSAARLFDIRRILGGLFLLYGVVVLGAGIADGAKASEKAAGIDINLWAGLGMLALGAFFIVWMKLNPVDASTSRDPDHDEKRASRGAG